jgi:hypothetical protein
MMSVALPAIVPSGFLLSKAKRVKSPAGAFARL